jgi:hypothetical protein
MCAMKSEHKHETMRTGSSSARRARLEEDGLFAHNNSCSTPNSRDLVRTPAALLIWGLPLAVILFASGVWHGQQLPTTLTGVVLTLATVWVGVACYVNGRGCGRTHCKIDGILLPLLSLVGALNLLGVTAFGWSLYSTAFWLILFLSFVPECFGLKYLSTPQNAA